MSHAPVIQGWCPGALRPMLSGDGYVVRIRARGGVLDAAQARGIAALARAHGNGLVDLSSRANVQLRGVTQHSHAPLIAGLAALGLIDANERIEARRNVQLSPFWREDDGHQRIYSQLCARLAAADAPDLPGKFGFAIDIGARPVLQQIAADIRIEPSSDGRILCCADGAQTGMPVDEADAADAAIELARWFIASGGVHAGRGRMAAHLANGAVLPAAFTTAPRQSVQAPAPLPGPCSAGFAVGFAFGQMHADTLEALAAHAPLRITPWRMLILAGHSAAPVLAGLITDPADPLLRVVACTGRPGCLQALQPTRPLAAALAPHVPEGQWLHVTGCAKGCANPSTAPLTLVAGEAGFDLVRNGTATAAPARTGLTAQDLIATPTLLDCD